MVVNCKKARKMILDYIDGNLSKSESLSIRQHISECDSCRQEFESFNKLFELIGNASKVDYPPESTWKNFVSDLHARIEKEALSEYVKDQRSQNIMRWGWVSFATVSVLFFIFSISLNFRPSPLLEQDQIQNVTTSTTPQVQEISEKPSIAEVISKTFIKEKELKELKKLEKIANYDVFVPSNYNPYILADTAIALDMTRNESTKTLSDKDLSELDIFDSSEYYVSINGDM